MRAKLSWRTFAPSFYWSTTYALRFVLMVVGRWRAEGREHFPIGGPVIVVSNHLSNADPPILAAGIARRRVRYMAKHTLFQYPVGAIVRLYDAFPVRRFEADMGALLTAERILKNGGVLGMFPEGTRTRSGYFERPHPGSALIALRSGAPVVPCAIVGSEQLRKPLSLLRKPRISVTIGEPIVVAAVRRPSEAQVNEMSERIYEAIKALLPSKYVNPTYTEREGAEAADGRDSSSQ